MSTKPRYEVRQEPKKESYGVWDRQARRFVERNLMECDAEDDADAYNAEEDGEMDRARA